MKWKINRKISHSIDFQAKKATSDKSDDEVAPRAERPGRRAASKKIDYSSLFSDEEGGGNEGSDNGDNSDDGDGGDPNESETSPIKRPSKRVREEDSSGGPKKKSAPKKRRAVIESDEDSDVAYVDDDDSDFEC